MSSAIASLCLGLVLITSHQASVYDVKNRVNGAVKTTKQSVKDAAF
jgi:hypothetical protein